MPLLLQCGLGAQLLQFEAQLGEAHEGLLGFRVEPLDLNARPLARSFRLRAQLLHMTLADIAGGGFGRHPDLRERAPPLATTSPSLTATLWMKPGDRDGRPDQALVGNEPSGHGRLAGVGRHRGEQHDGDDDCAEQEAEQANRQGRGENDRARQAPGRVGHGFLAKQVAHCSAQAFRDPDRRYQRNLRRRVRPLPKACGRSLP